MLPVQFSGCCNAAVIIFVDIEPVNDKGVQFHLYPFFRQLDRQPCAQCGLVDQVIADYPSYIEVHCIQRS